MKKLSPTLIALAFLAVLAPSAVLAAGAGAGFPTWDKQFTKGRFTVLVQFGGTAVFDKETGLVWERSPDTGTDLDWLEAQDLCNMLSKGGRMGWRLPTLQEWTSLLEQTQPSPALPAGHPFSLSPAQEDGLYWSATASAGSNGQAWLVNLNNGNVSRHDKNDSGSAWCVRGGQGVDAQ